MARTLLLGTVTSPFGHCQNENKGNGHDWFLVVSLHTLDYSTKKLTGTHVSFGIISTFLGAAGSKASAVAVELNRIGQNIGELPPELLAIL